MNTPCWANLGELGWDGCVDQEILLSSCGLIPASPGSPRSTSPAKPPPPPRNPSPLPCPPSKPTQPKRTPTQKGKSFESGSTSLSDHKVHRGHGKAVTGKQPRQQNRREEPPSLEGDGSPYPLLGEQVYVPDTDGVYLGVVTLVGGGGEGVGGTPRGKGDVSG